MTENKELPYGIPSRGVDADDHIDNPEEAAVAEYAERVLARQRLLPFLLRFNKEYQPGWVHKIITQKLEQFSEDVANKKSPRLMIFMPPRHGKLIAHDVEVYTTRGWVKHGELAVGDAVFHPSGKQTRVVALSEEAYADYVKVIKF